MSIWSSGRAVQQVRLKSVNVGLASLTSCAVRCLLTCEDTGVIQFAFDFLSWAFLCNGTTTLFPSNSKLSFAWSLTYIAFIRFRTRRMKWWLVQPNGGVGYNPSKRTLLFKLFKFKLLVRLAVELRHWSWLKGERLIWRPQLLLKSSQLEQQAAWRTWSPSHWTPPKSGCRWGIRKPHPPHAICNYSHLKILSIIKSFIFYNKNCNKIQNVKKKKVKNWCTVGHPLLPTRPNLSCKCCFLISFFFLFSF